MADLKPCGTPAAYRRHKRRGEDACEACKAAVREQQAVSATTRKRSSGEARLELLAPLAEEPEPVPDPLEVARDNLAIVEATLRAPLTPGGSIANLTKRREELVDRIRKLSGADRQEVSVLDQLAQRRKDRIAGTAN